MPPSNQLRNRLLAVLIVLILLVLLSSCASTTPRHVATPPLPPPPPPAECTRAALVRFAPELSPLPIGYAALNPDQRAIALLDLKADDTGLYQSLRAQSLRCAR